MKLPNGYGTVYNLGGKRRNPWVAKKTSGWEAKKDGTLKQKYIIIGYYPDRKTALQELAKFNENPYDIETAKLTFSQVYEKWFAETFPNEPPNSRNSSVRNYSMAYNKCSALHNMPMKNIKLYHLQNVVDNASGAFETVKRIKILFNRLYQYCIKYEILSKNYAEYVEIKITKNTVEKKPFTEDEIKTLWEKSTENIYIKFILILLYSGARINEILGLNKSDVDFENRYFTIKKSKTEAGIRIVPIHDKVYDFWKEFYNLSKTEVMFVGTSGQRLEYSNFAKIYWRPIMEQLGMKHSIHESRHTFISRAIIQGLNKTIVKKIVGHKSQMDLTERVYTHIDIDELKNEINKLS